MGYGDFKDLARRTASDNVLRDNAFNIAKIQNMMDIKDILLLWFINFLMKSQQVGVLLHSEINLLLIMNLNKFIMRNWHL